MQKDTKDSVSIKSLFIVYRMASVTCSTIAVLEGSILEERVEHMQDRIESPVILECHYVHLRVGTKMVQITFSIIV